MSTPPIYDLEIDQGDDEKINLHLTDPSSTPTPNADVDLSGCTLWFFIKDSWSDPTPLISKQTGDGIEVLDPPTDGLAKVSISNADTAALPAGVLGRDLRWEAQIKDSTGEITTIARGRIVINRDLVPVVS